MLHTYLLEYRNDTDGCFYIRYASNLLYLLKFASSSLEWRITYCECVKCLFSVDSVGFVPLYLVARSAIYQGV